MTKDLLTLPEAAAQLGVPTWQVRRVITRGLAPSPKRFASRYFAVPVSDLPTLRRGLEKAGYVKRAAACA